MPEGQVSHRNAQQLRATLVGEELAEVEVPHPRLAHLRLPERLRGERVASAEARGKVHLLGTGSGRLLVSHLRMSGAWRIRPANEPPWRSGLFLRLASTRWQALLYRCPSVRLLEPGEPLPREVARLGPDLLDAEEDPARATERALAAIDPGRIIGEAVMDQRVVAGIGNVYKSETLFLCGIDPWRPVGTLGPQERRRIGETAAALLADGVAQGGMIGTYRPPGAGPRTLVATKWVYGRARRPCRRCGTPVRSRGQGDANRTTYWCPSCQS